VQIKSVVTVARFAAACLLCFANAYAEVIPIASTSTGLLSSSAPTLTFYWQGKDSKAVLLFIPGGPGQTGLKPDTTEPQGERPQMFKRLSDPQATSGRYDVVLIESPYPLSPNSPYPAARGTNDHIKRIEAAALYYGHKTGLPVWVMGHSNGGISLTAFIKYLQAEGKMSLVSGMVALEIRSESRFDPPIDFPVLFVHHQKSDCQYAARSEVMKIYDKLKAFD
jgi:pimeloyl-ACP methyl ester carboxylesterase